MIVSALVAVGFFVAIFAGMVGLSRVDDRSRDKAAAALGLFAIIGFMWLVTWLNCRSDILLYTSPACRFVGAY